MPNPRNFEQTVADLWAYENRVNNKMDARKKDAEETLKNAIPRPLNKSEKILEGKLHEDVF